MRQSNYEVQKLRMREEFLKYDQEEMIRKFDLRSTEEAIFIRFVGREYRVDRVTGCVSSEAGEAGFNETMTIYDVLCNSAPGCRALGVFKNLRSMSLIQRSALRQEGDGLFGR